MFKNSIRRRRRSLTTAIQGKQQAGSEHNTLISNQAKTIFHCCAAKDGKLCGAASHHTSAS